MSAAGQPAGASSAGGGAGVHGPSAERRAEELMERATRFLTHAVARAREEVEDIVAEGRELHRHGGRRDA